MSNFFGFYPNRTVCAVLDEMREIDKVKNYSGLLSLIEEVQIMANRMEAALMDKKDVLSAREYISELKIEIDKLKKEKEKINE